MIFSVWTRDCILTIFLKDGLDQLSSVSLSLAKNCICSYVNWDKVFFFLFLQDMIINRKWKQQQQKKTPYDIFQKFMLSNYIEGLLCVIMCLLATC